MAWPQVSAITPANLFPALHCLEGCHPTQQAQRLGVGDAHLVSRPAAGEEVAVVVAVYGDVEDVGVPVEHLLGPIAVVNILEREMGVFRESSMLLAWGRAQPPKSWGVQGLGCAVLVYIPAACSLFPPALLYTHTAKPSGLRQGVQTAHASPHYSLADPSRTLLRGRSQPCSGASW